MLRSTARLLILLGLCSTISPSAGDRVGRAIPDGRAQELAHALPVGPQQYAKAYLSAPRDEARRWDAVYRLAEFTEAAEFLQYVFDEEPSARVRLAIVNVLGFGRRWSDLPGVEQTMRDAVLHDDDWRVSRDAVEALRQHRISQLRDLLAQRVRTERRDEARTALIEFDDRLSLHEQGAMLPTFMRRRERSLATGLGSSRVRVVAFGDFGTGEAEQRQVASAIRRMHMRKPFNLGITLGDNFYVDGGIRDPADVHLQQWWEQIYASLRIPFFAALGNHDWINPDMPATEVAFSTHSRNWRMLASYYAFTAGPVQFVALETNTLSEAQLLWLDRVLTERRSVWTVVYGHHPIYFSDPRRHLREDLVEKLLPVLVKHKVDVYVSGHHHSLQHLRGDLPLDLLIAGGGGKDVTPVKSEPLPNVVFAASAYGYGVIEASPRRLTVELVNHEGRVLHHIERQPQAAGVRSAP